MITTEKSVMKKFTGWLALLACSTLLAACGGGGGSPGTNSNGVAPSKAATVLLIASASTIDSSGIDGTEVTLTAIVKDANSNVLPGETVNFSADSGNITNTVRQTNSSGAVVEKLNTKGNSTPRVITITASAGNATSAPIKVTVVAATPTLVLTADSGVLQSAGAAGNEVNLTALVKDANNSIMPGVKVDLSADSGSLTLTNRITDANGKVTEKLSTGGDPTSRTITVTARTPGAKDVTAVVSVVGNKLVINNSSSVKVGASTDVTVKLVDSAGNALAGRAVTFSSGANALSVKGGGAAVTNTAGQLVLSYSAMTAGADTIVVKAMGETASSSINVSSSNFNVAAVDGSGNPIASANTNTCQIVAIHYDVNGVPQAGSVALSASRGTIYSDAGCTSASNAPLTLVNGNATGYVSASSPGVATLTANAGGVTVQGTLEFLAPLTASATISVQADPAVVGANLPGSTVQQTTLRAIVRDGTAANNLVKNAQVAFSIVTDPSGGSLTQPSVVTTASDGSASVSYIAGTADTKLDGVTVMAQLQGASTASALVNLTVAKKSLFIGAGTGATIGTPNSATYQLDYAVFVTDATGNAVPGVNITGSVRPRNYYKGQLYFQGLQGPWAVSTDVDKIPTTCLNEDTNSDGILETGEDVNGNGRLDPGITITVTSSGTTDANGQAIVSLIYPRDRANWLDVDLTIRGQVSGTEARYVGYVRLPGLSTDYTSVTTSPPGRYSPYGTVRTGDTYNGALVANGCTIPN